MEMLKEGSRLRFRKSQAFAIDNVSVGVIGLGYVGLPLAVEFAKRYPVVGFDTSPRRIDELSRGTDRTGEVSDETLRTPAQITFSADLAALKRCNVYVVAVPTPIDSNRKPNLGPLIAASETVGKVIGKGDVVIYESTVYPGATEGDCLPIVERVSGLKLNRDFFAGYSPERINPGDKLRPLTKIPKVTSGSTPEVAEFVDALYRSIIPAGTHKADSIKVAEAAKIIENTQRDVNIALINELSIVFSHLGIDTASVIAAAATKWNFMPFKPGLVGGHCIGVDPYYLIHKSESSGHIPDIIRTSREINDGMARHAASRLVRAMVMKGLTVKGARALVLGVTFKENCSDIRNSKVVDLVGQMANWGMDVAVHDPLADPAEVKREYDQQLTTPEDVYDAVVLAVPHAEFVDQGVAALKRYLKPGGVFFDMKAVFDKADSDLRL